MADIAGHGPPPKTQRSRARDTASRTAIASDGRLRGPQLPKDALEEDWHPRTKAWWDTWRRSAQAQTFTATDWDFLLDTALMHHVMWSKGRWEFASEVRLRAGKFGATPEDRARLKIEVESPGAAAAARKPAGKPVGSVTDISSRRSRLTSSG